MDILGIYHRSLHRKLYSVVTVLLALLGLVIIFSLNVFANSDQSFSSKNHIVTIYDNDVEKTIVSSAGSITEALRDADITISKYDSVSPGLATRIDDAMVVVSIHRARPIVVVDGQRQVRIITAKQTSVDIAAAAGIKLYAEDKVAIGQVGDILAAGGAGLEMKITRAKVINLELYGQQLEVRTQTKTVGEFLTEKKITLGADDGMSLKSGDKITDRMQLRVWRNGIQTVTATEPINFSTKIVRDPTHAVGYREVQTRGQNGQKTVIYQIEMRDGQEVSRTKISEVVNSESAEQVEIVGTRSTGGLTKSKGVDQFTDSSGVTHRETYYDLSMSGVMKNCGQGGYYTVREDGVKVDRDGYVIVAAHLGRYPRCSVVETSVGLGKVYDTGGFVSKYPNGFDLATDWSNYNGR